MLRKFIVGLALAGGLAIGAFGTIGSADAQDGGFCSKFDSGSDGFGPCTDAPNVAVSTVTDSGGITPTDPYLKVTDLSGTSRVCSSDPKYVGNWLEKMNGCGQFCFDFKVFNSGYPPSAITPSFTIRAGAGWATFVANFSVAIGDLSWHHICAPIADGATPPTSSDGHWVLGGGATWNQVITGVTMVQLPIDFTSQPSEVVGYDNICMTPGGCGVPQTEGCLKDSKVTVKCNGDGTYTLTLSGGSFTGTTITMTSQTAGVTVTPPQQPWAATTTWTITGATPGQTVILNANATQVGGGSEPGTDQCCSGKITIVVPDCPKGEVVVEKKVKNDTHASNAVINSLVFPIGLSCTAPSNLNVSFGLSNNGPSHTENNVPYTSVCTVTESTTTLPPVPPRACEKGFTAVWLTPVITPASATINAPVTAFTVVNELKCEPIEKTGVLLVEKKVQNKTEGNVTGWTYPITSTCGTPSTFSLPDGGTQTLNNIPIGTSCSISENTGSFPVPINACRDKRMHPVWSTTYVPASVIIGSSPVTLTAVNTLTCEPLKPACAPPMVLNAAGVCACPPGMHPTLDGKSCEGPHPPACLPPMVPGPVLGQCICPRGTVQHGRECVRPIVCRPPMVANSAGTACTCPTGTIQRGRRCVRPIECRAPLIPNAAGTACTCPSGTVRRGRECVRPTVCIPPAKLNRRGGCDCPRGMVLRGRTCVEQERRRPGITPGDIIRIPGGGRDNNGGPRGGGQGGGAVGKP